jgi:hypothetical protein
VRRVVAAAVEGAIACALPCVVTAQSPAVPPVRATPPRQVLQVLVDPLHPGADVGGVGAVVPTLQDAVAWANRHSFGSPRIEIILVPGVHEVQRTVRVPRNLGGLFIRAQAPGVRVVGGPVIAEPAWHAPEGESAARLPAAARASVRALDLPAEWVARFAGGLSGPVHAGLGVDVAAGASEVFAGGRPLVAARWPNEGYAAIERIVDAGSVPRDAADDVPAGKRKAEPPRGGTFAPRDRDRLARWTGASGAWMQGYWNWDWCDESLPVESVDAAAGTVKLAMPHRYGLAQRGTFRIVDLPEELDVPGECWIDRARGTVYAWLEGDEAWRAEVAVSVLGEPMIAIDGAADVEIRGLTFECTRGAVIEAKATRGLALRNCLFRNTGARAVGIEGNGCSVANCAFTDVGGTGVALAGGDRRTLAPAGNEVHDCRFVRCGRTLRTYNPAVRMDGVGQRLERCEIAELPHIAVFFAGNDHLIAGNDVHDVVQETGDAGAVYVGRDWTAQGTVIRGNLFSGIRGTDARYQNAVYLDDMASGITVRGNVFVRCNWGILMGGGRDNVMAANVFAGCGKAVSIDARGVGWMADALKDPGTSTLLRTFAAMPVDAEPWRSRYPGLPAYRTERFGRPVRDVLEDSLLIGTPLGRIEDREGVAERGTRSDDLAGEALAARCDAILAQVRAGACTVGPATLDGVGPRGHVGAPTRAEHCVR